jgi:hypothetical protein
MSFTNLAIIGSGVGLILLGLAMRGKKQNWFALVIGGGTMLVIEAVMLISGFKL